MIPVLIKKYISSSSELLSNNPLFGGQLQRKSNHEREADNWLTNNALLLNSSLTRADLFRY